MTIPIWKDQSSQGIRSNDQVRIAHTFRSPGTQITLNDPASPSNDGYFLEYIDATPSFDHVTEAKQNRDGLETYEVKKLQTLIKARGVVRSTSLARLMDKVELLNNRFDPVNVMADPEWSAQGYGALNWGVGFQPYSFSVPTQDTTNYPTGLIPMQYGVRPIQKPITTMVTRSGFDIPFEFLLLAADPRRYLQTETFVSRSNVGNLLLDNSLGTYHTWPVIVVRINGSTSGIVDFTLSTKTLRVDLSGTVNGDIIYIHMENRTIKRGGVLEMNRLVIGAYDFWSIPAVSSISMSVTNVTGTLTAGNGGVEAHYYRAFV